jgi:hypothetical protein
MIKKTLAAHKLGENGFKPTVSGSYFAAHDHHNETLKVVEDGHLPLVTSIQRDPFEWVGGERSMMGGDSIRLEHATVQQKEMSVALEREKNMIAEVAAETAHDILDRFAREENGIFELQKRMELPPSARNKDFLTRQNTATEGYIVWLQDSEEEGEWCEAKPMPIIPQDFDVELDRGETRKIKRTAAKDIDMAAANLLAKVSLSLIHARILSSSSSVNSISSLSIFTWSMIESLS